MNANRKKILNWLIKISKARAPTGFEKDRKEVIFNLINEEFNISNYKNCTLEIDNLGNILVKIHVGNITEKSPKIIIFSHMDEIGLTVRKILPNGRLLLSNRGGVEARWLHSKRIKIFTRHGKWINGIIPGRSIHTIPPGKRGDEKNDLFSLEVFVGANSNEKVKEMGIHVGSPIVVDEKLGLLNDFDENTIVGHSLDNLLAISVNLKILDDILKNNSPWSLINQQKGAEIITAFTVREEIGCVGSNHILRREKPDYTISPEIGIVETNKDAIESGNTLNGGPIIVWQEASGRHIFDYELCSSFRDVAETKEIPYQNGVFTYYGSESGRAQEEFGIPSVLIGIPMLSSHNAPEISTLAGIEQTVNLIESWLEWKTNNS